MNKNYLSLVISVFSGLFLLFMYLLLGKSMYFPLKVGYGVLGLVTLMLIGFNLIMIIKKAKFKNN